MNSTQFFVGIDVSKAELDIYVRRAGAYWTVSNDAEGHTQLVRRLSPMAPTLIALEATDGVVLVAANASSRADGSLYGNRCIWQP